MHFLQPCTGIYARQSVCIKPLWKTRVTVEYYTTEWIMIWVGPFFLQRGGNILAKNRLLYSRCIKYGNCIYTYVQDSFPADHTTGHFYAVCQYFVWETYWVYFKHSVTRSFVKTNEHQQRRNNLSMGTTQNQHLHSEELQQCSKPSISVLF